MSPINYQGINSRWDLLKQPQMLKSLCKNLHVSQRMFEYEVGQNVSRLHLLRYFHYRWICRRFFTIDRGYSIQDYIYLLSRCKDANNHILRPTLNSVVLLFRLLFLLYTWQLFILLVCCVVVGWSKLIFSSSPARQCKCGDNRITGHSSNEWIQNSRIIERLASLLRTSGCSCNRSR